MATLVASVSDDPTIEDGAEQKAALRRQVAEAGEYAGAIFAADKVSKVRELRQRFDRGELSEGDRAKLDHYRASLDMLSGLLPGHALIDRLRTDLEPMASGLTPL